MVASTAGYDGRRANKNATVSKKPGFAKQTRGNTSLTQEVRTHYLHAIREKYRVKGFSIKAIDFIVKSWRKSTLNQYLVYAKLWFNFSRQGLTPTVRNIVEFLVHLHSKGYNHKQIRQARSAVGVLSNIDNIGKHPDIKRVMKGMLEEKPQFPIYTSIWSVKLLFDYFRSLDHQQQLPLDVLTKKLAILIGILAGGQRCQTIHTIKATDIVVTSEKCIIPIYDPIKQSRDGKHMKPLEFKVFSEQKLCVIQNLSTYLERTRPNRTAAPLFISYQKPYHPVSKDTITT